MPEYQVQKYHSYPVSTRQNNKSRNIKVTHLQIPGTAISEIPK
ncbi:hypothetical protein Nmel_010653 [Mimus melanotis]